MIRKRRRQFPILCLLWLASWCPVDAQQFSAEKWTVYAAIQGDGSLWVTETTRFLFKEGIFTEFSRDLTKEYSNGIVDISASMNGNPMPPGDGRRGITVSGRGDLRVTWHFPRQPITSADFVLKYRLLGMIQREDSGDSLDWNVLPARYSFPIASISLVVVWPHEMQMMADPQVIAGKATMRTREEAVQFSADKLAPNDPLRIRLRFHQGVAIARPPAWQQLSEKHWKKAPYWVGGALGILMVGGWVLFLYYRGYWPQRRVDVPASTLPGQMPEPLPPALAGAMTSPGLQILWPLAAATILDLAQRGLLVIEELPGRKWYKGVAYLARKPKGCGEIPLLGYEKELSEILFSAGPAAQSHIMLSTGIRQLMSQWRRYSNAIKEEMRARDLISPERERAGNRLLFFSLGLSAVTIPLYLAGISLRVDFGLWPFLVPSTLLFVSLGGIALSILRMPFTDAAYSRAAEWKQFRRQLSQACRGNQAMATDGSCNTLLATATAAGLGPLWVKYLQQRGELQVPEWFLASQTGEEGRRAFAHWIGLFAGPGAPRGGSGEV